MRSLYLFQWIEFIVASKNYNTELQSSIGYSVCFVVDLRSKNSFLCGDLVCKLDRKSESCVVFMAVHFVFGKMWVQVFIFSLHATSFFAIQKEPVSGTWPKHIDDEVFSSRKRCIGFLELGTKASVFSSITSSRQASLMYCKRHRVIYHYTLFEESGGGSLWRPVLIEKIWPSTDF